MSEIQWGLHPTLLEKVLTILKKLKIPATFFIQVDSINRQGYMSEEDLIILLENGNLFS